MSPFFEVFFMSLRLVFSFVHSQFDKIIIYIKSLFDWKQRSLWEENDSNFSKIVNKYLALSSEVRGVLLSDIKWSIKKFEDPVVDTKGKIAVITGADQELGRTSAQAMAKLGLKVIMGTENLDKTKQFIDELNQNRETPYKLFAIELDTSYLGSVRKFAEEVKQLVPKIDILVNSAEQLYEKRDITEEGFERHFVSNYLGHFLLTNLLMDRLKESPNGRVINVSDMLHNIGNIDFQDLKFEKNYSIYSAFARSKLAQVMFNRQLAVEALGTNVTTYAMSTNILRYRKNYPDNDWRHHFNDWLTKMSDPLNGIQTILYLSLKEELRNESGFYYSNCQRLEYVTNKTDETSETLWKVSSELTQFEEKSEPIATDTTLEKTSIEYFQIK